MKLTLPYPPTLNRMYRAVVIGKNARVLLSAEARSYKSKVADICAAANEKPLRGTVIVFVDAYRPRKVGDLDGALKVALDSLQGFCYENDNQVVRIVANRFDDKQNPRLEIEVCPYTQTTLNPASS